MSDKPSNRNSAGAQIAAVLAGSWRKSPSGSIIPVEGVSEIASLLLGSGAGALAWWRIRHSELATASIASLFRETYLRYSVYALEQEQRIADVFAVLREAGVEPILFKGWAISRLYPEIGLRPMGDIDLCVHPRQRKQAIAALENNRCRHWVDFDHVEISQFGERTFEQMHRDSETAVLANCAVRILAAEDHLRALCLHFLKHGGWRSLWLCDIAAVIEAKLDGCNWDVVYGNNPLWARWIACVLLLARDLLQAEPGDALLGERMSRLPGWLVANVLKQWSCPPPEVLPSFLDQIAGGLGKAGIVNAIVHRWPNPIQATIDMNGDLDGKPRLFFQFAQCADRSAKLMEQLRQNYLRSRNASLHH